MNRPDPATRENDQTPAGTRMIARNHAVDAVVATLLLMLGAIVVFDAWRLGATWTDDGPGSGYFPFYIGLIMCGSALGILWQATISKARDSGAFVNREQLGRVLSVLLPAFVYVLGISFIGIYLASAIYISLFMAVLGRFSVLKSALTGLVVSALFFAVFEVWFKLPLFKGQLDPLWFLGY